MSQSKRTAYGYTFVVDDIAEAVQTAKAAAGDKDVSLLGGSISRQCLKLGLVEKSSCTWFLSCSATAFHSSAGWANASTSSVSRRSAFAGETHLRYCAAA